MTSLLKYVWNRSPKTDRQRGVDVGIDPNVVMDCHDNDDSFTEVQMRPMTYAEAAAYLTTPNSQPRRVLALTDDYSRSQRPSSRQDGARNGTRRPHASRKVQANCEYDGDELEESQRQRKRSNWRHQRKLK